MATKRRIPLSQISGVSAGGTATIDLPRNVRYHGLVLQYDTDTAGGATEANMEAEITEVRVRINDVDQRKASAAQIFDIYRTKGITPKVGDGTAPGFIPMLFSEPQREYHIAEEATAWGMNGVDSFQVQVDIANNSNQTPSLKGYAIIDDVQEAPMGIVKWKRNNITVGATGELQYSLSTESGDSYQGLYFFEGSAGDIIDMLIEWDGVKVHQLTQYQERALVEYYANAFDSVTGMYHIPLDMNNPADPLRTVKEINGQRQKVQELIATMTMGGANNVTLIREMIGLPD